MDTGSFAGAPSVIFDAVTIVTRPDFGVVVEVKALAKRHTLAPDLRLPTPEYQPP